MVDNCVGGERHVRAADCVDEDADDHLCGVNNTARGAIYAAQARNTPTVHAGERVPA